MRTRRVRGLGLGPRWIVSAVVPWMLASGLLISFTATAGTDATLRPGRLSERDVAAGPLAASTTWSPDVIDAGLVAPGSAHEAEPGEDGLPAPADSDGATPATPRAVALSSVTPAPADATPIEVAAANLVLPGFSARLDHGPSVLDPQTSTPEAKSHYADLIEPEAMDREQRCLAEAVYFEARSESEEGQAAVAQVVLNRVKSGLYPSSVCGVVYQNRHRFMGCQFSFACEGKSLRITDAESWRTATRVAGAVIEGRTYVSEVGGATHYHADYVRPGWSRRLKRKDMIGRHIFYQLKPNQT
ncbi:MAG: cell wall hydrolase [Methylorubrum populi]